MNSREFLEFLERERIKKGWNMIQYCREMGMCKDLWRQMVKKKMGFKSLDRLNRYLRPFGKKLAVVDIENEQ